jgi:hypothetical protein
LGEWVHVKHASDLVEAPYLCSDSRVHIISMSLERHFHANPARTGCGRPDLELEPGY